MRHKKNQVVVFLSGITKKYLVHHEKPTLVEKIVKGREEAIVALLNINFSIQKGERVGIIGHNGSGKTTLLKIIAGIAAPTQGQVETEGKVVSLIDLEAGFHPDLTGEQNIFLNGMILGMSKKEIVNNLAKIIAFADIGRFIDLPLFTYSEGMKLRLGFAVALHSNPEILILDENIYAGDLWFRRKAQKRLDEFSASGKTMIVVSHWIDFVRRNCDRVLVLKKGKIIFDGKLEKGLKEYESH